MKRFAAIIAILLLAALTASAAPYFPVTLSFTNSVTFTNNGPRAILAKVTVSVVTPQAASATIAIGGPSGTNTILYSTSTVFRVAHWPPSSTSTNTYLASNDTVIVSCTAAGQSYVVIDAVPFEQDEFVPLLIVDGNNVTSQPVLLKVPSSALTDQGGGRWTLTMNSSTTVLLKAEAALLYSTTQEMASVNALLAQETSDRTNADIAMSADISDISTKLIGTSNTLYGLIQWEIGARTTADLYNAGAATTNAGNIATNATDLAVVAARVESNATFSAATYATKDAAISNAGFTINGNPASNGAAIVISTLDTNAAAWATLTQQVASASALATTAIQPSGGTITNSLGIGGYGTPTDGQLQLNPTAAVSYASAKIRGVFSRSSSPMVYGYIDLYATTLNDRGRWGVTRYDFYGTTNGYLLSTMDEVDSSTLDGYNSTDFLLVSSASNYLRFVTKPSSRTNSGQQGQAFLTNGWFGAYEPNGWGTGTNWGAVQLTGWPP